MDEPGDVLFTEIGDVVGAGASPFREAVAVWLEVDPVHLLCRVLAGHRGRAGPAGAARSRRSTAIAPPASATTQHDAWVCPQDQMLWPAEFDERQHLPVYRAKPSLQRLPGEGRLHQTSQHGREISRPTEPWPHSEAARSHRGIVLVLVALAALLSIATMLRHPQPVNLAVAVMPLAVSALLAHRFTDHFQPTHPASQRPRRRPGCASPGPDAPPGPRTGRTNRDNPRPDPARARRLGGHPGRDRCAISVRVLREYERGVLFRLGRLRPIAGPGLVILAPFVDRLIRVDLRTVTLTIPPQEIITRDNVPARVNAIISGSSSRHLPSPRSRPTRSPPHKSPKPLSRSVLGRAELDTLLSERDELNDSLRRIIDEQTEPWGIKVTTE